MRAKQDSNTRPFGFRPSLFLIYSTNSLGRTGSKSFRTSVVRIRQLNTVVERIYEETSKLLVESVSS